MKQMMKNWNFKSWLKLTVSFLSLCLMVSCDLFQEEDEPKTELEKLPPITTTGENTFGCLVNGKAWVPETSIDATAFYQNGLLSIGANLSSPDQTIRLRAIGTNSELQSGMMISLSDTSIAGAEFYSRVNNTVCDYTYQETITGSLNITYFNKTTYTISGTFGFTTALANCDTVKITNGRFDLHYAP